MATKVNSSFKCAVIVDMNLQRALEEIELSLELVFNFFHAYCVNERNGIPDVEDWDAPVNRACGIKRPYTVLDVRLASGSLPSKQFKLVYRKA